MYLKYLFIDENNTGESRIETALRETFGHAGDFKPGQEALIKANLAGQNTYGVLPTGGGKSLCYQLPAVLKEGTTLVVSPLLALMEEQKVRLLKLGIPVFTINSRVTGNERDAAIQAIRSGIAKIVFASPEMLQRPAFQEAMGPVDFDRADLDEAHCLSVWGHDFRPDYISVGSLLRSDTFGIDNFGAYTATTDGKVDKDIEKYLELGDNKVEVRVDPIRKNLSYQVKDIEVLEKGRVDIKNKAVFDNKIQAVSEQINCNPGATIIYCMRRADTEKIATHLGQIYGDSVCPYHAGMEDDEKCLAEEMFQNHKAPIMVATVALGMGIDRPDIRNVIHWEEPKNLLAFAQETGRAGRDGEPATSTLLRLPPAKRRKEKVKERKENPPSMILMESVYKQLTNFCEGREDSFDNLLKRFRNAATGRIRKQAGEGTVNNPDAIIKRVREALNILQDCRIIKSDLIKRGITIEPFGPEAESYKTVIERCGMKEKSETAAKIIASKLIDSDNYSQALLWHLIDPDRYPKPA